MTTTKPRNVLAALRAVACEDILSMSDQDVIQESRELGLDATAVTSRIKAEMLEVLAAARREKIVTARRLIDSKIPRKQVPIKHPTIPQMRAVLKGLSTSNRMVQLAFREGKVMTDRDATTLFDDLVDLGAIKDDNSKHHPK